MHHDVAAALLDLLTGLRTGPLRPGGGTLWTVALDGPFRGAGPPEMGWAGGLDLDEEDPPAADRIVAVNRTARELAIYPGDVIAGGLATRAVVDSALVPPGGVARLRVEAIDSRWWPDGPPRAAGSVGPALALAVELACRPRRDGLAAVARTALWSMVAAAPPALEEVEQQGSPVRGWVLGDGAGVIGATVFRHHRMLSAIGAVAEPDAVAGDRRVAADRVQRHLASLAAAVARYTARGEIPAAGAEDLGLRPMIAGGAVLGLSAVGPDADVILRLLRAAG